MTMEEPGGRRGSTFQVTPGMRRLCATVLGMEAIVLGLVTPVAIVVDRVPPALSVTVGIGLGVVCVVVAGLLRWRFAYIAGGVVQVLAIGTGFLVPIMFFLGVIFTALWITAIFVARRVEGVT